ncbi:MAG: TrpB-like pyridoxal phosphate-dependent enzyme [Candidatus Marinimicrobia bacterium]|nr:TrpB-like pyridoxal phosphate-dependent enzyme [Candidatus Neomarinimicrobiota bacterium]MCF7839937.1 TrpB-like pyridoxal phosphate-dependent enzyme [Candidatus Neomarinimicrobiota bacterium]
MKKYILPESELPNTWYNITADLPQPPPPPLHPGTREPIGPDDLAPLFPMALIEQEVSQAPEVKIPEAILDVYKIWRPSPLIRATFLEKALKTPARIYYKYEGVSPAGSHKPNTAVAQAYYNKEAGVKRLATETGAGQWGSSLALAGQYFGLDVKVYMVRVSYDQKPYRRSMMQAWGAQVVPSPSEDTQFGRQVLAEDPTSRGSLGIAISEAVEDAAGRDDTKYSLGSVLNHVLLHQSVIGLETQKQMVLAGESPDIIIGCVGGGSNFAGLAFPFLRDKINGKTIDFRAVEPSACPTLTRGQYSYDFGDTASLTPLVAMHTLGHNFMPPGIHAGGLRYHGMAPLLSHVVQLGLVDALAYNQVEVFQAATLFASTEGIIPAPESAHAIKGAIAAAEEAREAGEEKVILFNLSGHGHFDMAAYDAWFKGELKDIELPESELTKNLKTLEGLPVF